MEKILIIRTTLIKFIFQQSSDDQFAKETLSRMQFWTLLFTRSNWCFSLLAGILFTYFPIFMNTGELPYGVFIPGVDLDKSPTHEVAYAIQVALTPLANCNYQPFVNMYIAFILFGITLLRILSHKLRTVADDGEEHDGELVNNDLVEKRLRRYIEFHKRIIRYVDELNEIVSTVILVEMLLFVIMLLVLLFTVIITTRTSIILWGSIYTFMIVLQLFFMYYLSNEIIVESTRMGLAVYESSWYCLSIKNQRTILLIILRAQSPMQIMIGGFAPATLNTFQSILNVSYSYCNILRGGVIKD